MDPYDVFPNMDQIIAMLHEKRSSFMPTIIYVEGPIGSGKSKFGEGVKKEHARLLAAGKVDFDLIVIDEPLTEWGKHLDMFYKDQKRYAFEFQIRTITTRLTKLTRAVFREVERYNRGEIHRLPVFLVERSYISDKIFAIANFNCGNMNADQFELYKSCIGFFIEKNAPMGTCHIYICPSVDTCVSRINKRDRKCESAIDVDYLQKLHDLHDVEFSSNPLPGLNTLIYENPDMEEGEVREKAFYEVFQNACAYENLSRVSK